MLTFVHHFQQQAQRYLDAQQQASAFLHLSPAQLNWKPSPTTWSVLECLDHIIVTDNCYHPVLAQLANQLPDWPAAANTPYAPNWLARFFADGVRPNGKIKMKGPRQFAPASGSHSPQLVQQFQQHCEQMAALSQAFVGKAVKGVRYRSVASPLIRFGVANGLEVQALHTQRHLLQAQRLTQHPDFPRA